jgi:DNA polymerase I-like protein with 3'-5' exonuclease and polymerase domains
MPYPLLKTQDFCFQYEMHLAHVMHRVEKRGVLMNVQRLDALRQKVTKRLQDSCINLATILGGRLVAMNSKNAEVMADKFGIKLNEVFNVNSTKQVARYLEELKLPVPHDRFTGKPTTGEDKLNLLLAETGHPFIKELLSTRELNKILGTYINCQLKNDVLYCQYKVSGTVGGRRSSSITLFGYGTNHQNLPKYSELGKEYRECVTARPGKVLFKCDQVSAEDWLVQGIIADQSGDRSGLDSLKIGGRHEKLAAYLFGKAVNQITEHERFLGKKTRHAGNYDMRENRMAESLAKEGKIVPPHICELLLNGFHQYEPNIRKVFHQYIQDELTTKRMLTTPLGRTRYFFGLRPFADNRETFKAAYSYIPQSSVGDNTGMAIIAMEDEYYPDAITMDEHDGVLGEVDDNPEEVMKCVEALQKSFNREMELPNGTKFLIPIEIEIGYDLKTTEKCRELSIIGLKHTLQTLRDRQRAHINTTGGAEQQLLQQA